MFQGVFFAALMIAAALPGEEQYLAGVKLENAAKYAEAIAAYQSVQKLDEDLKPFAILRIADCMRYQGQKNEALALYKSVETDFPPGSWTQLARYRQAFLYRESNLYLDASKLFAGLVDVKPLPWWMEQDQARAVETLLATDSAKFLGYELLNDRVQTLIYRDARLDSARKLLSSTDPLYLANAIKALLRSGEHGEASTEVTRIIASILNVPNGVAIMANHLADPMGTIAQLEPQLGDEWLEVLYIYTVRRLGYNKRYDEAVAVLNAMQKRFPGNVEAGNLEWWLARYMSEKGEETRAQNVYKAIVANAPSSEYADDAMFYIGYHEMSVAKKADAEKTFIKLAAAYPDSTYRPRVMWYAAHFRKDAGDMATAKEHLAAASAPMLADFYAHRAYEEYVSLETPRPATYQNLKADGANSFIQPYNMVAPLPPMPDDVGKTPAAQRLRFFGSHGMDEGEWEAMYYCMRLGQHPASETHYRMLAEAGFAHTVWQFLGDAKWGETNGRKSAERLRLEFPLAYWPQVSALGVKLGIDPYLILGLMKQESTFRATVVSHAGATGVMQVMPSTAKWLEQVDSNITKEHLANLKSPENSMQLGIHYLMRMIDRSDGNLVYALASYNAGPGNCDKWRKQSPNASLDDFIEKMPFSETKSYVKKVLGNYAAYRSLYPAVN